MEQMDRVISKADEMGIKLDEVSKDRLININADASGAMVGIGKVIAAMLKVKSKSVTITTNYRTTYGRAKTAGGKEGGYVTDTGIQKFATGGLPHAAPGWVTPPYDEGGIPAIVHKNEVILNPQQQAKLLFDIAKGSKTTGGTEVSRPIEIRNIIELDGAIVYEKMKKIDNFEAGRKI